MIGYIYYGKSLGTDERLFLKLAKKKKIDLVLFNAAKGIDIETLKEKVKQCDVIYNNSAEEFALEIEKTLEALGGNVVDSSKTYYYTEDKWLFFLTCKEKKIATPQTILLSGDRSIARRQLRAFNRWPVILKRVYGTVGEYVDRADSLLHAMTVIENFWKRGSEKLPIIAQEFVDSPSYRVTVIDKKIVQTALKENKGWKATGVYAKKFKQFPIDQELGRIIKRIMGAVDIKICGIDFLKRGDSWLAIEVNSDPAFDFFEDEREMVISEVLDYLKKRARA